MDQRNREPVTFIGADGVRHELSAGGGSHSFVWVPRYDSVDRIVGYQPERVIAGIAIIITGPDFLDGQTLPCGA